MDSDKGYVKELRKIADGQIRIEGKLDLMTSDYNGKISAVELVMMAKDEKQQIAIEVIKAELQDIKDGRKWLERTVIGQVIAIAISVIVLYFKSTR